MHRAIETLQGTAVALVHFDHAQDEIAHLEQVARLKPALAGAEALAVQVSSVGAAQVANQPTERLDIGELRVAAAHRAVLKMQLPVGAAADAQAVKAFPGFSFQLSTDTFKTYVLRHGTWTREYSGEASQESTG